MAHSEILPNIGIVPTNRQAASEDPLLCDLLYELTGHRRTPGSSVEMIVIEPNHYREVENGEMDGTLLCLSGYQDGRWRAFYDRWGRFPTNGLYAPVSASRILQRFEQESVEMISIDPLESLSPLRPGHAGRAVSSSLLKIYIDAATNDFEHQTHIPRLYAFKPGAVITADQILKDAGTDTEPLSIQDIRAGNMESLRQSWDRVGIRQGNWNYPQGLPAAA